MNTTRAFIEKKLAAEELPSLDVAMLTNQGRSFARSRLSMVYVRAVVRVLVHGAELAFMTREFPMEFCAPLFAMRAAFGLWSSAWWGPLEAVRRHVREHLQDLRPDLARASIEAWTCIAASLGIGTMLVAAWALWGNTGIGWSFDGLYGTYLLVSAFTLCVDLWSRTIHGGVFALGRVYRTRWSIFVPDLLELAMIVGLWPVLGPFALVAALLVTSLLRSALTIYYASAAYRTHKLPWPRFLRWRSMRTLATTDLRVSLRGLLGSAPNQLDRLLLIVLLAGSSHARHLLPIAIPYYALRPVAGVAQGWARTYYVDLIRMDSLAMTLFRNRLEALLRRTSMFAGMLAGTSLLAGGFAMFRVDGLTAAAWLFPLCLLRSYFSLLQIRAIAYAKTGGMTVLTSLLGAALVLASVVHVSDRKRVMIVTVALLLAAWIATYVERRSQKRSLPEQSKVALGTWLSLLCENAVPTRIHAACVTSGLARPIAVLHELEKASGTGRTTRLGSNWILWWEDARAPLPVGELARVLGGTCQEHASCDAPDGPRALELAVRSKLLPRELSDALCAGPATNRMPELRERFATQVPDGLTIDGDHASEKLAQLSSGELTMIRRALLAEAHESKIVPRSAPWQAAVYAPHGEPKLVFVWPARSRHAGEFRRGVVHAGWRDSLPAGLQPIAAEE